MSANVVNTAPFLRTTRDFPKDSDKLLQEINKSYLDTANAVNSRIIGIFPTNTPAITGESFFISGNQKQQTLRQIYPFTTTNAISHGITLTNIERFTSTYGNYTDGTNWYGLIAGSNVAIAGQVSFYITPTTITFLVGAGAPAVTKGTVILQWASLP